MANSIVENWTLDWTLRLVQFLFAIIVMGTDGYAINNFRGYPIHIESELANIYGYKEVPDEWGFLMFCASWSILAVLFHPLCTMFLSEQRWIDYFRVLVEAVALLSWLAGFVALAVNLAITDTCSAGRTSCASLTSATVFGAVEWLLFMVTAALTAVSVFKGFWKPSQ